MANISDAEIELGFRKRVQSQALCHLVGKSVDGHTVMRFRQAGTWPGEINQPVPATLIPILTNKSHPQRMSLPDGPLVVALHDDSRAIIVVSEYFLSDDSRVRGAAFEHFAGSDSSPPRWISPYVLNLLNQYQGSLRASEESEWIHAGLMLKEAIDTDFHVNCAGVTQASRLRFHDLYQQYLNRVMFPRAKCFEHDRPSTINMRTTK